MAKVSDSEYIMNFRWNLNDIIYNCEEILKDLEKVSPCFDRDYREFRAATETLKSPRTTNEEVYNILKNLVRKWDIFGDEFDEMEKAYKEEKDVFIIISSRDGQIPVLCCLTEKDLFENEKESEEDVQDTLESLPEVVDEVTIKGVKYKKVLIAKWEKA
jgi:hypothetical protein